MIVRSLAALVVVVLAAAACGDAASESTSATDPPPVTPPATTAAAAVPSTDAPDARTAQDGDTVSVHYRGTLDDGSEFDSSEGRQPLTFVVGSGQVIRGFDDAVRGLAVGGTRTVRVEPADAYGEVDPARVLEFPIGEAPPGVQVGDQLSLNTGQRAEVVEVTDEVVRVDVNHPLAGQALTFEVELVSIG